MNNSFQSDLNEIIGPRSALDAEFVATNQTGADSLSDRKIFEAVRGSFIVSILTLPFGYLVSMILARVSPDAAGTYGALGIYLSVISAFIYFGGGTVTMRFVTELPRKLQWSFLLSYYVVTVALAGILGLLVWTFPAIIRPLTGSGIDPRFFMTLLGAAPIPLMFFEIQASLRGLMEVTFAQALGRVVTVVSCLLYAYLWFAHSAFFREHYVLVIVASYLGLLLLSAGAGLKRFRKLVGNFSYNLRWFLPLGFWRFSLAVQIPSMLALLQLKIDEISVLGALGLSQLGVYFVMSQLAGSAELLSNYFLDGIFSAVMNLDSIGDTNRNIKLYATAGKYVSLIGAITIFPLICFAHPILRFLGAKYSGSSATFAVMLLFASIDCLGPLNHTLLVGLKRMKAWTAVQAVRLVGFVLFFEFFSRRMGLIGVVLARGCAWLLAGAVGYWVVLRVLPVRVMIPRQFYLYATLSAGLLLFSFTSWGESRHWSFAFLILVLSIGLFLLFGGYRIQDLYELGLFRRGEAGGEI